MWQTADTVTQSAVCSTNKHAAFKQSASRAFWQAKPRPVLRWPLPPHHQCHHFGWSLSAVSFNVMMVENTGEKSTRVITLFFCFFYSSARLLLSDCKLQMYCLIVQVMLCMVIVPTCPFSSNVHFLHYFKYDFCPLVFVFMFSLLNSSLKVIALQLKRTAAFIFDEKRRMK